MDDDGVASPNVESDDDAARGNGGIKWVTNRKAADGTCDWCHARLLLGGGGFVNILI